MSILRFTDGVEIDTSGEYRTLHLKDGWYVVGQGLCAPCTDEDEAIKLRDQLKAGVRPDSVAHGYKPTTYTYRNPLTDIIAGCYVKLWADEGTTVCFVEASVIPNSGPPFFTPGEPVRCHGTLARLEGERCLEAVDGGDGPPIEDKTIDEIREWADRNGY